MADANTILLSPPRIIRGPSDSGLPRPLFTRPLPAGAVAFSYEAPWEDQRRHFLDACSRCRAPLTPPRDIYMYKGDTPFCSEGCRQEQIELDEAREREASTRRWRWRRRAGPSSVEQQVSTQVGGHDAIIAS